MDWLRTSLIAAIALVCFLLMIRWTDFQEQRVELVNSGQKVSEGSTSTPSSASMAVESDSPVGSIDTDIPVADGGETMPTLTASGRTITVKTDVLSTEINLVGGDFHYVGLPTYYAKLNTPDTPFELLVNDANRTYAAESGLIGKNGTDAPGKRPQFKAEKNHYELQPDEETLTVDLFYQQSDAIRITKRFNFTRGDHLVDVSYIIHNQSTNPWAGQLYGQIKRNDFNPVVAAGLGMQPFLGAATTTDEDNYKKFSFDDLEDEKVKFEKAGGWVAMVQHYFISAWIPNAEDTNEFELFQSKKSGLYYLRFFSPKFEVAAGSIGEKHFSFYAGPKDIKTLETVSPYLDLTVDYGILWWIAKPLFYALDFIHGFVGNWGIAIILLTVCIKIMFFYPSAASYRSMAKMRKVQPKMAELKERFGDDRQKFSAEMMKLYRTEKVNPLGGCLPILIQMPVFISLYWVLGESVELRHAPFFLWIHDLSVKDPYFVLPLIMGATMWIQQKLNPTPPDPMQAKVMQMMPIFFTFLFLVFPAGLVLYWVVNNTLSITQQYIITKQIENSQ